MTHRAFLVSNEKKYRSISKISCGVPQGSILGPLLFNNDFSNLCEWILGNKQNICFGEDRTKSILFRTKSKLRKVGKLNITYQGTDIKQNSQVTFLSCILDETMSGEPIAYKTIKKSNSRLNYLFRKKHFLTPRLRRLLCNALIQSHFDYALRGILILTKN